MLWSRFPWCLDELAWPGLVGWLVGWPDLKYFNFPKIFTLVVVPRPTADPTLPVPRKWATARPTWIANELFLREERRQLEDTWRPVRVYKWRVGFWAKDAAVIGWLTWKSPWIVVFCSANERLGTVLKSFQKGRGKAGGNDGVDVIGRAAVS